ncbi:hypothetical protein Hanom_Chr15g01414481 [Helianthus anomalus]
MVIPIPATRRADPWWPIKTNRCMETMYISPIIPTRTYTLAKMVKTVRVSHNYQPAFNLGYMFDNIMTVSTNPQVFKHTNGSPTWWCINDPKRHRQLFTMVPQHMLLFLFFHIMQNQFRRTNVALLLQFHIQFFKITVYSNCIRVG